MVVRSPKGAKAAERLYLIGIDSAPVWIIKELTERLKLRGFGRFIDEGIITDLESTLPPITAAAWPSIYTGLTPGEHGVMNFFSVDSNYTKRLSFYDALEHPPFWETLADNGVRCLVVTPAMVTEPSASGNVDMATGFPLRPKFNSERLKEHAASLGFEGEPEIEQDLKEGRITLSDAVGIYVQSIRKRAELSKRMIMAADYGMVFVCFTEIDRMQHYSLSLPDWRDYIGPLYAEISRFLEWIMDREKSTGATIMIVSDHGAQPIRKKLLLNSWLIGSGYARLSGGSNMGGSFIEVTTTDAAQQDSEGLKKGRYREQLQLSSRQPATRFICASVVENDSEFMNKRAFDMKGTKAFASLSNNPVSSIWANDSRFGRPSVTAKTKPAMLKKLGDDLLSIKNGGERVIASVRLGEEYYGGTKLFIEPDLIVEARPGYTIDVFNHAEEVVDDPEPSRRGDHTRYGVFGSYPAGRKVPRKGLSVLDVRRRVLESCGMRLDYQDI